MSGRRWPEPRALWQDNVFVLPDRTALEVHDLSPGDAASLLELLVETADDHQQAAVRDEALTLSSGERRTLAAVGVPLIEEHPPLVWLASTLLVRTLARIAGSDPAQPFVRVP